ncbi:MAG TPA: hypothetical protein VEF04_01605 [Blastocatellia bacterium]|nr:hypothetical protein [Blastocatellia bacterium]
MKYRWYDFVGSVGVGILVVTYLLLQLNKLESRDLAYSLLNALGAGLIAVSLLYAFNLSAFIIELFWILISLIGIIRHFTGRKETQS